MLLVLAVTIQGKKYASHEVFTIYDKNDDLKWFIQKPPGTKEWQNPEWSTHENFCTATAQQSNNSYPSRDGNNPATIGFTGVGFAVIVLLEKVRGAL